MQDTQETSDAQQQLIEAAQRHAGPEILDLGSLLSMVMKWSWIPALAALYGLYTGYQDLKGFQPQHVASMIVLPSGNTGGAGGAGTVESIAAELGLIGRSQSSAILPFDRLKFYLGSIALAERLQEKYGIMQILYAGDWDEELNQWRQPTGEDFEMQERRRAFLRQNQWSPPNLRTLAQLIESTIKIGSVSGGPFKRLSVQNGDPEFALWFLTTIYFEADELIRERDRLELKERLKYVEQQLALENKVHIRDGLRQQLASELGREVSLEVDLPYVASIVEHAYVDNILTEPNLPSLFGIPTITGGVVGFFLASLIVVFRRERKTA